MPNFIPGAVRRSSASRHEPATHLISTLDVVPARKSRGRAAVRAAVEPLEARQMLSVSVDAAGWTSVAPGPGSSVFYVSSSQGNDFNNGLSATSPLRTIGKAKSLVHSGTGDQILLKTDDTFHETFGYWSASGASSDQPLVIGSYGTGARPVVETGSAFAFVSGSASGLVHDISIIGIRFHSDGHDPSSPTFNDAANPDGFSIVGGVANFLIENCSIEDYTNNLVFQDYFGPITNLQIRRSQVLDSYADNGAHSQGAYIEGVDGILLEDNVFDHNGWNESKAGAGATVFNHNVYVQARSDNLVARGNVFAHASSHGLQARPGGIIQDNVFLDNPIGLSYGLVNGSGPQHAGGVFGRVTDNVFIGGRDISGQPRGIGMEIANIAAGKGTSIDNNLFTGGLQDGLFAAINIGYGVGTFQDDQVGINDLTIRNNTIAGWAHGMYLSPGLKPGVTAPRGVNNLKVSDNDFQVYDPSWIVYHGYAPTAASETWTNNRYGEKNGQGADYKDPGRTLVTYDLAIGGVGSVTHLLATSRTQSQQNWQAQYTARAMIGYLKTGYADPTDPTPVTVPPPTYPTYVPPKTTIPWVPPVSRPTTPSGGNTGGGGGNSGGGNSGSGGGGVIIGKGGTTTPAPAPTPTPTTPTGTPDGGGTPTIPDPFGTDPEAPAGGSTGGGATGGGATGGTTGGGTAVGTAGGSDAPSLPPLPTSFPVPTGQTPGGGTTTGGTGTGGTGGTGTGTGGTTTGGGTGTGNGTGQTGGGTTTPTTPEPGTTEASNRGQRATGVAAFYLPRRTTTAG